MNFSCSKAEVTFCRIINELKICLKERLPRKCVGACAEAMTLFAFLHAKKNGEPSIISTSGRGVADIPHPLAVPEI